MDDELLTDGSEIVLVDDSSSASDIYDENYHGTPAGNTIILSVTPTPRIDSSDDNIIADKEETLVNEQILETLQNIEEAIENQDTKTDSENEEEENLEEENLEEENLEDENQEGEEEQYTLSDIFNQLEDVKAILTQVEDDNFIHYKNNELILTFVLGFIVAFFFGFVVYCILGRIR